MSYSQVATYNKANLKQLVGAFKEAVLESVINGTPFESTNGLERKAFAVHTHLLETNDEYRSKIAKTKSLSDEFKKVGLIERLEELCVENMPLSAHFKAFVMIVPHAPLLLRGHLLEFQLTSMFTSHLKEFNI